MGKAKTTAVKPANNVRGRPFQKGHDPRRNLKASGRPPDEESVTHWLKKFAAMTPQDTADEIEVYARLLRMHRSSVPIAGIVAARALIALMNEPDARLFDKVVERIDGVAKAPGQNGSNTFNAVVINQKTDDGTLSGIFGILARTGAFESIAALPEADSIHTAPADDEAIRVSVAPAS